MYLPIGSERTIVTLDNGIIDITPLIAWVLAYLAGAIIATTIVCGYLMRCKKLRTQREQERMKTEEVISKAEDALHVLFRTTNEYRNGSSSFDEWLQHYRKVVVAWCPRSVWIDTTRIGQLPLMRNAAFFQLDRATEVMIHVQLHKAELTDEALVAA